MNSVPFNTKVPGFQTKEDEEEFQAIEEEIANDLLKLQWQDMRARKRKHSESSSKMNFLGYALGWINYK